MFLLICFDIFINFTSKSFSYHLSFRDSFLFFACRYEIWKYEMQIWNLSPRVQLDISIVRWAQSWAIESNARREIPYLRAPAYCSLCNFLRITLTADLTLPIFLLFCYLSPFKLLDILSKQFDMDICHICDCNWSGKFLIRLIQIGDSDIRLEMCNSHTLIQAFNLSTPLSDQHFDTHTSHKGDDQNAANRRQAKSAVTVRKGS